MSQIEVLEQLIDKLQEEQKTTYQKKKIFGFTLSLQKAGNGIQQWRAYAYYKGKVANIYIGNDAEQAVKKIKAWVEKNPYFQPLLESQS
jgi:hypothetical protein